MRALVTRFISLVIALSVAMPVSASALMARAQQYADEAGYEVFRNAKPVGDYLIRFRPQKDALSIEVQMQIQAKIFGLFSYDYLYSATEIWRNDELDSLYVRMVTNGDEEIIRATREAEQLVVTDADGSVREVPTNLITTHHWFDEILNQSKVLNTLNGRVSEIAVEREIDQVWMIDGVPVNVTGFRLGGDLKNTLSWYDDEGLWRGMTFKARDGSSIDVRWRGAEL